MQITAVWWGAAGGTPPNESSLQLSGGAHEYWTLSFAWHSGLGLALHSKAMERTGLSPFGLKGAMSPTRGDPAFSCLLPLCPAVQRAGCMAFRLFAAGRVEITNHLHPLGLEAISLSPIPPG